jgi:hypothetical protein
MLPEISRRCLSCGAAVRAGSRFCQQCGKTLEAEDAPPAAPPAGELSPQEQVAPPTKEWTPPTKEFRPFERPPAVAEPPPTSEEIKDMGVEDEPAAQVAVAQESRAEPARAATEAAAAAETDEAGQAGDLRGRVARVREGTRARVGRMREEAIVVLEETPDDSGLRFVLVAAALFILSLVLLFLSTTVLR